MIVSFRWFNLLLSFVAALSWFAMWAYNLNTPPTGVTKGTFIFDLLNYSFIILGIVTILVYMGRRHREGNQIGGKSLVNGDEDRLTRVRGGHLMDMTEREYRAYRLSRRNNRRQ